MKKLILALMIPLSLLSYILILSYAGYLQIVKHHPWIYWPSLVLSPALLYLISSFPRRWKLPRNLGRNTLLVCGVAVILQLAGGMYHNGLGIDGYHYHYGNCATPLLPLTQNTPVQYLIETSTSLLSAEDRIAIHHSEDQCRVARMIVDFSTREGSTNRCPHSLPTDCLLEAIRSSAKASPYSSKGMEALSELPVTLSEIRRNRHDKQRPKESLVNELEMLFSQLEIEYVYLDIAKQGGWKEDPLIENEEIVSQHSEDKSELQSRLSSEEVKSKLTQRQLEIFNTRIQLISNR